MEKIVIVTDSGADLPRNCEDVIVIPYSLRRVGESTVYSDNGTISHRKLMDYIDLDVKCDVYKPSYETVESIIDGFEPDKFYLYFPSEIDRSVDDDYIKAFFTKFNSVNNTAVCYTHLTGLALGLLVKDVKDRAEFGFSLERINNYVEDTAKSYKLLMVPNMDYMGYSKVTGFKLPKVYDFFKVSPLLRLDEYGNLVITRTYRKLSDVVDYYIDKVTHRSNKDILVGCSEIAELDKDATYGRILNETKADCELVEMTNTNAALYGSKVLSLAYKEIL